VETLNERRNAMQRFIRPLLGAAVVLSSLACADNVTDSSNSDINLSAAFSTLPTGYAQVLSSYAGGEGPLAFSYGGDGGRHGPGGHRDGLAPGIFMGGGFHGLFLGGIGFGHHGRGGLGHWPFGDGQVDSTCAFNASSGRVVCPAVTRNGLTINKSVQFTNAAGTAQPAFDSLTTNTINTVITAAGSFTRRDSAVTTVQSSSNRTVSGLAAGSTERTVNGASDGRESTAGRDTIGTFTAVRLVGDTVKNVRIPVTSTDSLRYPVAGTVIRQMQVTVSGAGRTTTNALRREVVTYNGTNTATVVITRDGTTKTCTLPLPRGRLTCPE
jgi:hypothetical protein